MAKVTYEILEGLVTNLNQNNILIQSYIFLATALLLLIAISSWVFTTFSPLLSFTFSALLIIFTAFWLVKVLLSPLFTLFQQLDITLKETLHELNIPVATIQANVTLLSNKLEDEKQIRQLKRIQQASNQLLYLHKSLEHRVKKQYKETSKESIELKDFIQQSVENYKILYPQAIFNLNLEPTPINVNSFELQKSLDNIISNAIKYCVQSPIIHISLSNATLSIVDNAKGIDESQLLKIFERYYQTTPNNKGSGIGLSIVKSFCDANTIALSINSKVNEFTKIVLNFQKSSKKQ